MPHRQGFPNWQQAPHPRLIKERVAGLARPRQPGNTLLYSFLGRGGGEEKDFLEALPPGQPWGHEI